MTENEQQTARAVKSAPGDAPRRRAPRADAVRNRAKVLDAARAAFASDGLAVPLDEIARRAGVGAGTVYRHFPTKEALFEAVVADRLAALATDAAARIATLDAADSERDGTTTVKPDAAAGDAFFSFFVTLIEDADGKADLADALSTAGVGLQPSTLEAATNLQQGLAGLLSRAQDAGAVRDDVTSMDLHSLAFAALTAERKAASDPNGEPGRITRFICDGLRPQNQS